MTTTAMAGAIEYLEAGNWQAAHEIVQNESGALACWAHGLVHLMEGDRDNAQYWYRRAHRALPDADALQGEIAALKLAVSAA